MRLSCIGLVAAFMAASAGDIQAGNAGGKPAFGDTYRIKIATMDLQVWDGCPKALRGALGQAIPETLERIGPFKAISMAETRQILGFESQRQLISCDDTSCLAELGGALGADFLVNGSIAQLGRIKVVQLQLTNIRKARVEARVSREYGGADEGLLAQVRAATQLLVRDLLGQRSGGVELKVSEEGATVLLDGSIVGVSPLAGPLTVPGGLHTLGVEKRGFIAYKRDLNIMQAKTLPLAVDLRPSREFVQAYKQRTGRVRAVSWLFIGLGGIGLAAGGGLVAWSVIKTDQLNSDIREYNQQAVRISSEYERLDDRARGIGALETGAIAALSVGVVALMTGLVVRWTGEDPDRYDELVAPEAPDPGPAKVSIQPVLGPGSIGLRATY